MTAGLPYPIPFNIIVAHLAMPSATCTVGFNNFDHLPRPRAEIFITRSIVLPSLRGRIEHVQIGKNGEILVYPAV